MVYEMSMLDKFFTEDEVEKMSERTSFDKEDKYFHFDDDAEDGAWIESLNDEDISFYNENVPLDKILLKMAA